jgi:1-acyl-sn-glycerol-3-phosphate acyltransferase
MLIWIRSVIFNVLFYLALIVMCLIALPTMLLPYRYLIGVARLWARISLWLLRVVCGVGFELRGIEHLPRGALLMASKHQSMWETFVLLLLLDDPVYILKRELMWIPVFGWFTWKTGMVSVDRGKGPRALVAMMQRAREELARGRQIIIFPEGTRRLAGAEPKYKYGVAHLYAALDVPCVPVALNSGLFWPRRSLLRYPGTIVVEILPAIAPGLNRDAFFAQLEQAIETATATLIAEGRRQRGLSDSA